jgi:hypothetical protein
MKLKASKTITIHDASLEDVHRRILDCLGEKERD